MSNVVAATVEDLVRAVRGRDDFPNPPGRIRQVEYGIRAAVQQLAFVSLGGRTVRLELPNGAVLETRLVQGATSQPGSPPPRSDPAG